MRALQGLGVLDRSFQEMRVLEGLGVLEGLRALEGLGVLEGLRALKGPGVLEGLGALKGLIARKLDLECPWKEGQVRAQLVCPVVC